MFFVSASKQVRHDGYPRAYGKRVEYQVVGGVQTSPSLACPMESKPPTAKSFVFRRDARK